ncbi:MAG: lipolytic protein family [Sphingobacteriaceae bacterium]|jgi:hypothetical protein|nr:lipolytic protein family [Sphingobacteriaceae bacterium]
MFLPKLNLLFLALILAASTNAFAQAQKNLKWWDPASSSFPVLEGQGWAKDLKEPYNRLPARAEKLVRKPVWALSCNSTGLIIRFKTTAPGFTVQYAVKGRLNMPHFSTTGVSGLDLYSPNHDGGWSWAPGDYKFGEKPGDTISYTYNISSDNAAYKTGREYFLYLPNYNTVDWMKIGVPEDAVFEPLPVRTEKPIAIYGTSITQGACASRPGMTWPAIVGRRLNQPMINLGFSGNGTLDKEMIDLFAEIDARMYVLDCLGNMMDRKSFPKEEVKRRVIISVKYLQSKRPGVPIVLAEFGVFNDGRLDQSRGTAIKEQNEVLEDAFAELQRTGTKNIYLLRAKDMNMGMEDTVDYGHPTDLGLVHYADAFEKAFMRALAGKNVR